MARWEAIQKADYAQEESSLERQVSSAESTEKKKSDYSGFTGMVGAIGVPMLAAALAPVTFGASAALPALMGAVGVGSALGRTAGSALGGKSKKISSGKFLKSERSRSQSLIDDAGTRRKKDILWGSLKDAGTAGFIKAGGMEAFKEIGAKSLTKAFGEETAENLYKATGMLSTGDETEFAKLLEGTAGRDMWNQLGEINPLQIRKDLIGKRDLKAAKKSLIGERMKARMNEPGLTSDPSGLGEGYSIGSPYYDKAMIEGAGLKRSNELGKMNLELANKLEKQISKKDITKISKPSPFKQTQESLAPKNIFDLIPGQIESGNAMPSGVNLSSPIENAQNTLNQKVSMYNQSNRGAISSPKVSGLSPRGQAFKAARERGDKSFWFEGMEYNTQLAEELG